MARKKRLFTHVSADDAQRRFGRLLSDVEELGVWLTITRRGVPIARLVPVSSRPTQATRSVPRILREFIEFRDAHPLDGMTARELLDDGRRK